MEYIIKLEQLEEISNAVTKLQYINTLLLESNPLIAREMITKLEVITKTLSEVLEVKNDN
jgi:hypothetical protein